jgi:hypothetical protein
MEFVFQLMKIRNFWIVLLLFIQTVLLVYLSWATSPNRTEIGHLGAAAYFWNTGKFDVFHVNPPLIRMIAGSPVFLFCNPKYNAKPYSPFPEKRCEWSLGNAFVTINGVEDIRCYVFLMRIVCIPFILLGGYFGYRFSLELYGQAAGFVFLILWTFSPSLLGWGATICPDVAAASIGIVGLYLFRYWLNNPDWRNAIFAGLFLGLMPLTKITWIIAPPIWFLLWILWTFFNRKQKTKPPFRQFVSIILVGLYVLNMGYFFDGSFRLLNQYRFISGALTNHVVTKNSPVEPGNRFKNSWLGHVPVPFPAEFVQGIDTQKRDFERGMESFACGVWSDRGWWWYYGYALLLKEPVGVLGLLLISVMITCFGKNNFCCRDEMVLLLPMFLIFAFVSSQTGISAHPRYVILILPMLYIFCAKSVKNCSNFFPIFSKNFLEKGFTGLFELFTIRKSCLAIFLIWNVTSSLLVYPHSLSYFNEFVGGSKNGHQYLLGSCIDWGQDEYELRDWCRKHPEAKPLYISYSPSIPLGKLGVQNNGIVPELPKKGSWMIIGVNELYDRKGKYIEYRNIQPVMKIGRSICVFYIENKRL